MKFLVALVLFIFAFGGSYAQKSTGQADKIAVQKTIIGFLNWYKKFQADTSRKPYAIAKGGYRDTTTSIRINFEGVEKYLDEYRQTGFVSETFTNSLRSYFTKVDKTMARLPPSGDMQKIPGWDIDFVLQTYEPKNIFDHISQCRITKMYIIYRKALVSVHFTNYTSLLFILTRQGKANTWVIDYLGLDASAKYSLFKQ